MIKHGFVLSLALTSLHSSFFCFSLSQVGAHTWTSQASPLPLAYTTLMQAAGGSGGLAALQAAVAELPTLAIVLGPRCAHEQLLPPLMALLPCRLGELRGALAHR
jgi:hypothetical protein